jgi:hypothetical protein
MRKGFEGLYGMARTVCDAIRCGHVFLFANAQRNLQNFVWPSRFAALKGRVR